MPMHEKRKFQRFRVPETYWLVMEIYDSPSGAKSKNNLRGAVIDVSIEGMLIDLPGQYPVKTIKYFTLYKKSKVILSGQFEIVRTFKNSELHQNYLYGVHLLMESLSTIDDYTEIIFKLQGDH